MKAMIFAAGLGTRLRPLTDHRPKALVEIAGIPLLEIAIRRLKWYGITEIIVNIHHFADQIETFLQSRNNFGINIALSDEREMLLDTGGGLKRAAWFFEDAAPFFVVNTDVLSTINLMMLYEEHQRSGGLATLAVRHRDTSRYLLFNDTRLLCGWKNRKNGEERWCRPQSGLVQPYAFSGIHVIDPAIFRFMPPKEVFSIIDVYLEAGKSEEIRGFIHDHDLWLDVGKLPELEEAASLLERLDLS